MYNVLRGQHKCSDMKRRELTSEHLAGEFKNEQSQEYN